MSIPGEITPETFLAEYWQKKPLLVRNAFPDFESPVSPDELAGLALEEDVESRLIIADKAYSSWALEHGPFPENRFENLPESHWTLLVQGVDLWVPAVDALIYHFDFLPRWRIDDIMVSYATVGGSVGPHFDYYDVFLLQGAGKRRWSIGQHCDESSPLLENAPLKVLSAFEETDGWVLQPGDMLYLPPCIAHHGVAEDDECMTYSVGFRSPTAVEMLNDLALELMSRSDAGSGCDGSTAFLRDPPLNPSMAEQPLDDQYLLAIRQLLEKITGNDALLTDWFARYMTRPKNPDVLPERPRRMKTKFGDYEDGEPAC